MKSETSRRTRPGLPPPLPADLVEGQVPWPELDHELAPVVDRTEALAGDTATTIVSASAAATMALDARLTRDRADELVLWTADELGRPEDEARDALFSRVLLEVILAAPSRGRAVEAIVRVTRALAPATEVRLEDDRIVAAPAPGAEARCRAYVEDASRAIDAATRLGSAARAVDADRLAAAQRRLRRLSLDLHDGPAQDVAALAADAALLEADLDPAAAGEELVREARAVVADVRRRLSALGRDIRDLAEVLEPRAILRASLRDVIAREAAAFAARTGVEAVVEVDEELGPMTASQQIALARVARESLTNIRDHARATAVSVTATKHDDGVTLVVEDDGCGFDADGEHEGLGLAGMHDRVRLLGGTLRVESRPGGPTRVTATVPRWRPAA